MKIPIINKSDLPDNTEFIYTEHAEQKSLVFGISFAIGLLFFLLFIFNTAWGFDYYSSGFESSEGYSSGYLDGQNVWGGSSDFPMTTSTIITSSTSYAGSYSVYQGNLRNKVAFIPLNKGTLTYYTRNLATGSSPFFNNYLSSYSGWWSVGDSPNAYSPYLYGQGQLPDDTNWHKVVFSWDLSSETATTVYCASSSNISLKIDNVATNTCWWYCPDDYDCSGDDRNIQYIRGIGKEYIDNITWSDDEGSEFSYTITPTYPSAGSEITVPSGYIPVYGTYSYTTTSESMIPVDLFIKAEKRKLVLLPWQDYEDGVADTRRFILDISTTASGSYSFNVLLPDGTWELSYWFSGVQNYVSFPVSFKANTATTTIVVLQSDYNSLDQDTIYIGDATATQFYQQYVPDNNQVVEDLLRKKFPFAYFYDLKDIVDGFATSATTTNFDLNLTMSWLASSATSGTATSSFTTSTLPVVSFAMIQDLLDNDTWSLIRTYLGYFIWVGLGFYIYNKFKGFKF